MSSLILDTCTRAAFHTMWVFSLFMLFSGHNAPGGGFVGGLIAGAALVLRYAGHGTAHVRRVLPVAPELLLGTGIVFAAGTGATAWLAGGQFLQSGLAKLHLPVLGEVKVPSVLAFDVGVYLVVVGLVLALLETLGRREPQ
ncbi:MAG: hypothetical protein M3N17_08920 [Actinomycetota bacterium]|nr:hypothetical protein [Actinomycetota bacterium]